MSQLIIQGVEFDESTALPFAESGPQAGFPSPVPSQYQEKIDLNRELVSHPESTFYAKVVGDSMIDANIYAGDILVVDRSIDFQNGDIAVCIVDDEFTVKHIFVEADHVRLVPANSQYPELRIESDQQFSVWGRGDLRHPCCAQRDDAEGAKEQEIARRFVTSWRLRHSRCATHNSPPKP